MILARKYVDWAERDAAFNVLRTRANPAAPKLAERFLAWSVGSSWRSYLDGDDVHLLALDSQQSPLKSAIRGEDDRLNLLHHDLRHQYIDGIFDQPIPFVNRVQPDLWWSDRWAGRETVKRGSRGLRWEVYDEWHRRWCSAMAYEQLVYSFAGLDLGAPRGRWPLDTLTDPVRLIAGELDEYPFTNICSATRILAERAGNPAFGPDSGHALADERPIELAAEIDHFLSDPGPFL